MQYFGFMINKNYNTFECKRMGSYIWKGCQINLGVVMSILLKAGADAGNNGLKLMVKGQDPILFRVFILYI